MGKKLFFWREGDLQTRIGIGLLQHLPVLKETKLFLSQPNFLESTYFVLQQTYIFESRTKSAFIFAPFSARLGEGGGCCSVAPLHPFFLFSFVSVFLTPPSLPLLFWVMKTSGFPCFSPPFHATKQGFLGSGREGERGGDLDGLKMYISFFFALFQGAVSPPLSLLEPRISIHS